MQIQSTYQFLRPTLVIDVIARCFFPDETLPNNTGNALDSHQQSRCDATESEGDQNKH